MDRTGCEREPEARMNTSPPSQSPETKDGSGDVSRKLLLRLEMQSDPTILCAIRGAVERLTESFGFTPEESRAITLAVDEALTNIIRHAYHGRPDQPIELYFHSLKRAANGAGEKAAQGLEFVLCDRGPAIEESKLCGRALDDVKPGGLGLHFIKESMDVVEYKRADEINHLRLVKYVSTSKQEVNS